MAKSLQCARAKAALAAVAVTVMMMLPPGAAAQSTRHVAVADTHSDLQFFDEVQVANGVCPAQGGAGPFNQLPCATSVILAGDSIQWIAGDNLAQHSATSGSCPGGICTADGIWDSENFMNPPAAFTQAGQSYTFQFTTAGTFPYFCTPHKSTMTGQVIVQDFSLAVSNPTLFAYSGTGGSFNTTTSPLPAGTNQYTGQVVMSCTNGSPPATCNAPTVNLPASSPPVNSSVTVNGATGDYSFQIQGVGSDANLLTHAQSVTLHLVTMNVTAPAPVTMGGTATVNTNVSITTQGTFPNPPNSVTLSCSGVAGISCSGSFTPTPGVHVVPLQVMTSGVSGGSYMVTLNADPGGGLAAKTTPFTVNVQDYSLSVSPPTSQVAAPNVPVTYNGALTAISGYNSPVTLSCQGNAPAVCTPCASPVTPTAGGAAFCINASNPGAGSFNFSIQGVGSDSGATTHSAAVSLSVFSVNMSTANPASVSAIHGNPSNPTQVTLSTSSFNGLVVMACGSLPTGTSCQFTPASPVALTPGIPVVETVTVLTTGGTPNGANAITINATPNGLPTLSTPLTVNESAGGTLTDVQVTMTHATTPDPVPVGGILQLDLVVKNNGPNNASGVVVALAFSTPISEVTAPSCSLTGPATAVTGVSCNVGTVNNGVTAPTISVKFRVPFVRSLAATANVSSAANDSSAGNNTANSTAQIRFKPLARPGLVPMLP